MQTHRTAIRRSLWLALALVSLVTLFVPAPAAAANIWEVTTYGNGELLASVFKGIALFASENGGLYSAMKVAGLVALLAALFAAVPSVLGGQQAIMAIPHVAITAGVVGILCSPNFHTTVAIVDRVALSTEIISGIPLPVSVIGYASSYFGERLAEKIEQAIYPVDFYGKFTESGLGWGPRVVQTTMNVNLIDMRLATDLDAYIRLCLIPDVQVGRKTIDQILKAKTVEEMLGDTNPAIPILLPSQCNSDGLPENCAAPPADQRCNEAFLANINPRLGQAADDPQLLAIIGQTIGKDTTQVHNAIDTTAQDVLGISANARDLLKVRFAANQLIPSIQAHAALAGQSGVLAAWSISAAEAQQTSSWITIGNMIQMILPFFHATLEFLFYGFLLFAIPLTIVMPRIFPQVIGNALWLQLWPLAYVFANRILYMQATKAGLYSNQLDWGMSVAASQPIMDTFNYAYAASGFPVAIGVILLGGMIFGGSYAMTKVVQHGPWHTGSGMGSEAAMGNVSAGKVDLDQRNVAPRTQMMDSDAMGQPVVKDILGDQGRPVSVTTIGQGMRNTSWGTGVSAFENLRSEDGFGLSVSSQGSLFTAPNVHLQSMQSEAASQGSAYASAQANTDRSTQGASQTIGFAVNDLASRLGSTEIGRSNMDAKGTAESITRTNSKHVGYALGQVFNNTDKESYVRGLAVDSGMTLGLSFMGSGAGTKWAVTGHKNGELVETFALNETQSRTFDNAYARSTSSDHTFRETLSKGSKIAASHDQRYSFDQASKTMDSVDHAQSKEQSSRDTWERTQATAATLSTARETDIATLYWNKHYKDEHGSMDTARQTEGGKQAINTFFGEARALFMDPGRREELGDLSREAIKSNPQGLEMMSQVRQELENNQKGIEPVRSLTAPDMPVQPVAGTPPALQPLSGKDGTVQAPPMSDSSLVPGGTSAPITAPASPQKTAVGHATQGTGQKPHPVNPNATVSAAPAAPPSAGKTGEPDPLVVPGRGGVPSVAAMQARQADMQERQINTPHYPGAIKVEVDGRMGEAIEKRLDNSDGGATPFYQRFLPNRFLPGFLGGK